MIKKIITITILFSLSLFSEEPLSEVLVKETRTSNYTLWNFKKNTFLKKHIDYFSTVYSRKEHHSNVTKWSFNSTLTRHLNPMLNELKDCAFAIHGLDQALGIIGEVYYSTTDSFSIGIKATILNNQYGQVNSLNQKVILKDMELNTLFLVARLNL